ncbi:hypothetical protein DFH09DRAFT_1100419 [Mycena vulgaris]|nr:hypothetical protein DFH09DRAFT_1100419 [Mycena vulgaris]
MSIRSRLSTAPSMHTPVVDLVEVIIDHLSEDKSSLMAFSLVHTILHSTTCCDPSPARTILSYYVRALKIVRYDWRDDNHYVDEISTDLSGLSIRSLTMKLKIGDIDNLTPFSTSFRDTTELVLNCHFGQNKVDPVSVVEMISMFPALERLLYEMSELAIAEPMATLVPQQDLRSLKLNVYSVGPILGGYTTFQRLGSGLCSLGLTLTGVLDSSKVHPSTGFDVSIPESQDTDHPGPLVDRPRGVR